MLSDLKDFELVTEDKLLKYPWNHTKKPFIYIYFFFTIYYL